MSVGDEPGVLARAGIIVGTGVAAYAAGRAVTEASSTGGADGGM